MNNSWKRFLSLLLAMVMVLSLGVTGFADEGEAEETPAEIAEGSIASAEEEDGEDPAEDALPGDGELEMEEISPDKVHIRKLGLEEEEDLGEIVPMDEEDLNTVVRASIFLDEPATLAAGYSAKGVGTNSAAIGYRDALKARQAEMTAQVESVIGEMPFLTPFYHITLTNENYMDKMVIDVEIGKDFLTDDMNEINRMTVQIQTRLKEILNLKAIVKINLPGTLERFEGKAKHVTDNRSWE